MSMQQEIEAKFLRQDHDEVRRKLQMIGAVCESPMKLVRRTVFDFPDRRLQQSRSWVRLREELDGSIELMLKTVAADEIGQTFEQPVTVTDYEAAHAFLRSIGLDAKGEQESRREVWRYNDVEIMLDEWPWVPPFIEIEASSKELVQDLAAKLNLNWQDAQFGGVTPVYADAYNISSEEFESLDLSMQFEVDPPEVLTNTHISVIIKRCDQKVLHFTMVNLEN